MHAHTHILKIIEDLNSKQDFWPSGSNGTVVQWYSFLSFPSTSKQNSAKEKKKKNRTYFFNVKKVL